MKRIKVVLGESWLEFLQRDFDFKSRVQTGRLRQQMVQPVCLPQSS
jgi:hypothetical protein